MGQKIIPLKSAAFYVPGGFAIYPSTLYMNVIPALIAGIKRLGEFVMGELRHFQTRGVILKTANYNEIDRLFTFISPEIGVKTAVAYGALKIKSRFCASVQPFVHADFYLYKQPKFDMYKLEDIHHKALNDFLKSDLSYIYLTSFFSEVILNTFISSEENKNFYYLIVYSLDLLREEKDIRKAFLFFINKFFFLSGYHTNLTKCKTCHQEYDNYYYYHKEGGIYCEQHTPSKMFKLTHKSLLLWKAFLEKKYIDLKKTIIEDIEFKELYPLLLQTIRNIFEKELKTIKIVNEIFIK